ncbi:MAG TPA: zinc-binding alcohol dehydrogenase family protein [Puia sp.]|jgi:2-desacetyl-2-hydroxyethyl bacteriochlorophyllide A dehydrogenase|nr:zinc-binding alcohol dehydrogenase family protein [Puia sp.]
MKALVCIKPGQFEYREIDAPLAGPGQAIIKIRRVGICGTDLHAFQGTQPYFEYPRILGHELAGDLVDLDGAPGFVPGEAVTVIPYFNCGVCIACRSGKPNCCVVLKVCGVHIDGGMVDYLAAPSASLVHGAGLGYDQLALVEPLAIGAHAIRRAGVEPGEFVLVVGAGPIGLGVMEAARIAGGEVIAMDINEGRLKFCRERLGVVHTVKAGGEVAGTAGRAAGGADEAIAAVKHITRGEMPAVVVDATGNLRAIDDGFKFMAHGGRYVLVGLQKGEIHFSHPELHKREGTVMSSRNATRQDFEAVMEAMRRGLIDPTTYITNRVRFEEVKAEFAGWLDPEKGVIKAMVEKE